MQGEIRGAPGVGDSRLALIGGVSNRQVKPDEGEKKETRLLLPKEFHLRAAFRLSSSDINILGVQRRRMMPPM